MPSVPLPQLRRPLIRSALTGLALLFLAACGTSRDAGDPQTLSRQMFVAGFEDIDSVYIEKLDIGNLALAGLQQLSTLDSDISARRTGNKVELLLKNQVTHSTEVDDDFDPDDWGEVASELLNEATLESPKIKETPSEKIYEAMFSGIVGKLDQFSRYAGIAAARENRASRDGFGGIGVRISVEDDQVRVISVQHYTPAERMGLKTDDVIIAIEGEPTKGMSQSDVVGKLRGPVDSKVDITVQRPDKADPFDVTLTRAHVVPETVAYRREGNVAYFRLYGFNAETASSLKRAVSDAEQEIGAPLAGLILDLRDNPGGLLDQSVAVSNLFLTEGRVVSTHGRHPDSHQYYEASGTDITEGKPIVVMVNGDSASAAEIVAAALQDNGRAVVVGTNTYGKGTVQKVLTMPNKGEITITWARFHAPSGYTLHHLGVLPSVCTSPYRNSDDVMQDLRTGHLPQVPIDRRNATKPDDTPGLTALRKICPARTEENPIDLDVAKRLVAEPALFASAVHLAEAPQLGQNDRPEESPPPLTQ